MGEYKNHFSLQNYRDLLIQTKNLYPILGFEVLEYDFPKRFAILRHDIDFSPVQALKLAKIESDMGIRATYYVLVTGIFYNALDSDNVSIFREIEELGHDLGLHYDASYHSINSENELHESIKSELSVLNRFLNPKRKIETFSFHNTTEFTMQCLSTHYGGLRNPYANILQKSVEYISDSNGFWRFRSWSQLLSQNHRFLTLLYLLFHFIQ